MNKEDEQTKIVIERTYEASIDDVWDLWTTKDGFESWWGPQGFRAEVEDLDARVGGTLRYKMVADSPEPAAMKQMGQPPSHGARSTFSDLVHHRRLVLTNVFDFIPDVAPYESRMEVDFSVVVGGVRMVINLHNLHDAEWTTRAQEGMASQLTKLDARFVRVGEPPVRHETLRFQREYAVTPDLVFETYVDVEARARWSAPSDSAVVIYTQDDFRVGGADRYRCGDRRAPQYEGEVRYVDIVDGSRILYSEVITAGEKPLAASMVTWEIAPTTEGSRLTVTVQVASFVGEEMVVGTRVGMNAALDNLGAQLAK